MTGKYYRLESIMLKIFNHRNEHQSHGLSFYFCSGVRTRKRATSLSMPVLWISNTLMPIWIQILGSNPWKSAKIGSYSIHFGLSSSNWCGSGSWSSLSHRCGSGFLFDVNADPGYQNDADPCGSGSTTLLNTTDLIFFFCRLECRPPVTCRPPPLSVEGSELGQHSR